MTDVVLLEVFNSISGEVSPSNQGCLTTFVRFSGCNLKCWYCDTKDKLKSESYTLSISDLVDSINEKYESTGNLCLTGGEPLLQKEVIKIVLKEFDNTWIETNGTIDFTDLIGKTSIIADWKLDNENEVDWFIKLTNNDFIKFVISSKEDIEKACFIQKNLQYLGCKAQFAFSPIIVNAKNKSVSYFVKETLFPLLEKEKNPKTIINIQIHKYLEME